MASLHTLGADDLLSLIEAGDELDMSCDHCATPYMVSIPELEAVGRHEGAPHARRLHRELTSGSSLIQSPSRLRFMAAAMRASSSR
jgi:hypothetical protein